jgi:hypothetical protein
MEQEGASTAVSWRQTQFDRVSGRAPVADSSVRGATAYRFGPGVVSRADTLWLSPVPGGSGNDTSARTLEVQFASFDSVVVLSQESEQRAVITYAGGAATQLVFEGYGRCSVSALTAASPHRAPTGPLRSLVRCVRPLGSAPRQVVRWELRYRR